MSLTEAQKVDVRRHAGYGFLGVGARNLMFFNYFEEFSALEYRMNWLAPEEETVLVNTYLPNLNALEMATATASDDIDTLKAAVWSWNPNEVTDRIALYNYYRKTLCAVMQVPVGPYAAGLPGPSRMVV